MRVKTFYWVLRLWTAVVLFFFVWTFGPLWQAVAFAAISSKADAKAQTIGKPAIGKQKPEEKLEGVLDAIREHVNKAGDIATRSADETSELDAIKARKGELDNIDVELRAEFAETGAKLKASKLPQQILDRHATFVKNYETNLAQLKSEIDDVDKAKTKADRRTKIEMARLHLEKVKKPKLHQKLEPDNLRFRARKANKAREPRLKREDFERDFPQQKNKGTKSASATVASFPRSLLAKWDNTGSGKGQQNITNHKPILLAFNGLASNMPLPINNGQFTPLPLNSLSGYPILPVAISSPLTLAQATPAQPTVDDLAETSEVQFTQDIQNLAAQLNYSPVKIFEWVKNNIEFVPTYGSIQGANMCLQSIQCNDMDTASLLIALLRVSNIPAHYVFGTIEVPMDKVMNWVGGFTDPNSAATAISSGGIPAAGMLSGGMLFAIRMEHVWVEAYIPYGNYRGAIMDQSIKTWIPMDGSFKQYTYINGFDMTATVPFSQDTYLSQIQSENPVHFYQNQIQAYLDVNMPDTSIVDVKGYRQITQKTHHFLPSTLPYATVAVLGKYSAVPAGMEATAAFALSNPATGSNVSYTASTYDLAGKRVTVSYLPATSADEALIASYGGFLYNVPAYMLNLVPVLKVEGAIQLIGEATTLGSGENLTIQFAQPGGMNESINKNLIAGAYYAVGMDLQGVNENVLGKRNYNLTTNILSQTAGTLGNDDLIGEHLHILMTTYFLANDKIYKSGAKLYNTTITRTFSEGITSFTLSVSYLFGISKAAMPSGINIDVAMDRVIVVARDGNTSNETVYMNIAGLVSSYNEHDIFEKIDGFSAVSTVRALQVASMDGIAIQKINSRNIAQILPTLQVDPDITTDIQNAVNAGKEITIPQTNLQIKDWNGTGYIVKDPLTGSGTYMISGGLAGGDSTSKQDGMQIVELNKEPLGWVKDNIDPQTRQTISLAAACYEGEGGIDDDEIQQNVLQGTTVCATYDDIGMCTGLVVRAYRAAGIDLVALGKAYKTGDPNYSPNLYTLSNTLNTNNSVRTSNDSLLIGDIIFWRYTYDRNKNCTLGDDAQPTHVGIVEEIESDGTVLFVHASSSSGVTHGKKMNIVQASSTTLNDYLNNRWNKCKTCSKPAACSATSVCKAGTEQINKCPINDWEDYGHLAGQLFYGYATIRNPSIHLQ